MSSEIKSGCRGHWHEMNIPPSIIPLILVCTSAVLWHLVTKHKQTHSLSHLECLISQNMVVFGLWEQRLRCLCDILCPVKLIFTLCCSVVSRLIRQLTGRDLFTCTCGVILWFWEVLCVCVCAAAAGRLGSRCDWRHLRGCQQQVQTDGLWLCQVRVCSRLPPQPWWKGGGGHVFVCTPVLQRSIIIPVVWVCVRVRCENLSVLCLPRPD